MDIADAGISFYRRDWQDEAVAFNAWLADEVAGRPGVHVAHWSDHSRGRSSWFLSDGLHLTSRGQRAYAAFVARAVDRSCPAQAETGV